MPTFRIRFVQRDESSRSTSLTFLRGEADVVVQPDGITARFECVTSAGRNSGISMHWHGDICDDAIAVGLTSYGRGCPKA